MITAQIISTAGRTMREDRFEIYLEEELTVHGDQLDLWNKGSWNDLQVVSKVDDHFIQGGIYRRKNRQ